jgi:hypothetical protein
LYWVTHDNNSKTPFASGVVKLIAEKVVRHINTSAKHLVQNFVTDVLKKFGTENLNCTVPCLNLVCRRQSPRRAIQAHPEGEGRQAMSWRPRVGGMPTTTTSSRRRERSRTVRWWWARAPTAFSHAEVQRRRPVRQHSSAGGVRRQAPLFSCLSWQDPRMSLRAAHRRPPACVCRLHSWL